MKITLAKSAGFCFGVKRAIDIALKTAALSEKVFMLGDIVHNEEVVKQIQEAGIKKITRLAKGKNKILLIRAHGSPLDIYQKAKKSGYTIIDATCPMVKEIHKIAQRLETQAYRIIIIGDKQHDEVYGIMGQLKGRAMVIDSPQHIPLRAIKDLKKAGVVVQSTQNLEKVLSIVTSLKNHIPDLKFFNTICNPTRMKQQEIKTMPKKNDVMIVIGSRNSANTKRLYEIAKSLNRRSYWVTGKKDIRRAWFRNAKSVGVTAGASTPDSTTWDIIEYLKRIG